MKNSKRIALLTLNHYIADLNHTCKSHNGPKGCWADPPENICNFDLQCNGIDDYKYCSGVTYKLEDMDEMNCNSKCYHLPTTRNLEAIL